jgi:hypothetical protein
MPMPRLRSLPCTLCTNVIRSRWKSKPDETAETLEGRIASETVTPCDYASQALL